MRVMPSCMGLVPLKTKGTPEKTGTPESSLPLFPRHSEKQAVCNLEEGPHQNQLCWYSDLRHPVSRTMRNSCLLFTCHPVQGTVDFKKKIHNLEVESYIAFSGNF